MSEDSETSVWGHKSTVCVRFATGARVENVVVALGE